MISEKIYPALSQNNIDKVSLKNTRFLSITFDDGLKNSTDIATSILDRYGFSATFYIVTGWVEPKRVSITEPFNIGRSHGTWDYWRQVSAMGHEVGSHTYSHVNAGGKKALLFPWIMPSEIARSHKDLCREVPQSSHSIAMPWNATTRFSEFLVRRRFAACRLGTSNLIYNDLPSLTHYHLASWAPSRKDGWAAYEQAIDNIPEGGWLILQFHGIGDEGWEPVTPEFFDQLCGYITKCDLKVASIRDIIEGSSA